jgi:hypothetical protein
MFGAVELTPLASVRVVNVGQDPTTARLGASQSVTWRLLTAFFCRKWHADNVCFACNPFEGHTGDSAIGVWSSLKFGGKGMEQGGLERHMVSRGFPKRPL